MQFIFDHMAAFFAMSGVMLIFGIIQIRGTQSNSEAVLNNMVYSDISNFSEILQVDLSNMRTESQVTEAISAGKFTGGTAYECSITKSSDVTTTLTFPTLANPFTDYDSASPENSEIVLVSYVLTDTGDTITIPRADTEETVTLYTIERIVDGKSTGGSSNFVTHFLVEFLNKGGTGFNSNTATCTPQLSKVRFELKFAIEGVEYVTADQENTNQINVTRLGTTVDLANME